MKLQLDNRKVTTFVGWKLLTALKLLSNVYEPHYSCVSNTYAINNEAKRTEMNDKPSVIIRIRISEFKIDQQFYVTFVMFKAW